MTPNLNEAMWEEIKSAVELFRGDTSYKQIKGEGWTVYKTASCVRIDLTTNGIEGEPVNA